MHRNCRDSAVCMLHEYMTTARSVDLKACSLKSANNFLPLQPAAAASYSNLLYSYQLEGLDLTIFIFQAKLNDLANSLHQRIETLCLRVTTAQRRNAGHIVAAFVLFDEHGELSGAIH